VSFFQSILDFIRSLVAWWFIVEPWEQAVRVRFGSRVRLFQPGIHLRLPFFDVLYKQNIRRRIAAIPIQTLTTRDLKIVTLHGSIGYRIADVLKLQMTLHDAESSVKQQVLGVIARYVAGVDKAECAPATIMARVAADLDLSAYGLADVEFFLIGYVSDLPTYRLIQDSMQSYGSGEGSLSTTSQSANLPKPG
jgi:regulator of protease activity HflC (stomatin/prohibitin superfamily)